MNKHIGSYFNVNSFLMLQSSIVIIFTKFKTCSNLVQISCSLNFQKVICRKTSYFDTKHLYSKLLAFSLSFSNYPTRNKMHYNVDLSRQTVAKNKGFVRQSSIDTKDQNTLLVIKKLNPFSVYCKLLPHSIYTIFNIQLLLLVVT